eukprot:9474321-Pyramimonas_sp.AAC.1
MRSRSSAGPPKAHSRSCPFWTGRAVGVAAGVAYSRRQVACTTAVAVGSGQRLLLGIAFPCVF